MQDGRLLLIRQFFMSSRDHNNGLSCSNYKIYQLKIDERKKKRLKVSRKDLKNFIRTSANNLFYYFVDRMLIL